MIKTLQGHPESIMSKCMCLWFSFGDFSGKNNCKEKIDCESLLRRLASEQDSVMITGLFVNTGSKYVASIYGLCTLILTEHNKGIKK